MAVNSNTTGNKKNIDNNNMNLDDHKTSTGSGRNMGSQSTDIDADKSQKSGRDFDQNRQQGSDVGSTNAPRGGQQSSDVR